jgi:thiol-disulfide isomerase/thioredoxin
MNERMPKPKAMKMSKWVLPAVMLVVVFVVWMVVRYAFNNSPAGLLEKYIEEKQTTNTETYECDKTDKPYSLVFFYMDSCPHCVDFKPVWEEFVGSIGNMPYASKLCTASVSANNDAMTSKYNVQGFPTVLLINNNSSAKPVKFVEERTIEKLYQFVTSHVSA